MTNPDQAPHIPSPDELAVRAPGFIDHVPTQEELVADAAARAEQIAELEKAQPIAAVREAMAAAGIDLTPDAQREVRQPYIPPTRTEPAPAPQAREPYQESEVDQMRLTRKEIAEIVRKQDQK